MDRSIIYPGQVPIETDLLKTNQNAMVGLAKLSEAVFGTAGVVVGFGTTQTVVPSMAVFVAPGEIYSLQNLESTAFSSLPQDLTHSIVKQGIALDAATLAVAAPATAGFSINYLVQVAYQDVDAGTAALPYYNASNPSVAYSGPANSGAAQPTQRQGAAVVSIKAGVAATTGTQTTPAPDSGKLGVFVVTVASGATTVVNANISRYASASSLATPLVKGRISGIRMLSSSGIYVATAGVKDAILYTQGAGGGGGSSAVTGSGGTGGGGGSAGGATSFTFSGLTLTAPGGDGGVSSGPTGSPVFLIPGPNSGVAVNHNLVNASCSAGNYGAIISSTAAVAGSGGSSYFGNGPRGSNVGGGGGTGTNFGCGGAGALSGVSSGAQIGGNGAQGVIMVMEIS
jgi:hypothetical protein